MTGPRILTFNFHEPYLCLMAKMGLPLFVGEYSEGHLARTWQTKFRPLPPNITIAPEAEWRRDLDSGAYDVVIAQNETNAADLIRYSTPKILICHNRRNFLETTFTGDREDSLARYADLLERLQQEFEFVFISQSKKKSYGFEGRVILPGIDVDEYGGYRGDERRVLRVGNMMRARNLMFDVDLQEAAVAGLPNRVLGEDPLMPEARPTASFAELLDCYRGHRCLLHISREAYEDGYNLSMLEAMACGMPVAALANATSPLTDGQDGLVGTDAPSLHKKLKELLDDPEQARTLGTQGRETVATRFPIDRFADAWRETIELAAERGTGKRKTMSDTAKTPQAPAIRVLMEYTSSPFTTGRYLEEGLRKHQDVVTLGEEVDPAQLAQWGFQGEPPNWTHPDHARPVQMDYAQFEQSLTHPPHIFLWVDSGMQQVGPEIEALSAPRACYLIDTHLNLDMRIAWAKRFQYTFVAQSGQAPQMIEAGVPNVAWMPLACSAELHDLAPQKRIYDVAYVGSLGVGLDGRRRGLLETVRQQFPNHRIEQTWPEDMARIYNQAKIVVNACVNRDVNMRVFEAMASGALLITDQAAGLEDLFEDGKHLVIYRDDANLPALIKQYLADTDARERIAAAGRELVLAEHTYEIRARTMISMVLEASGAFGGLQGESRFHRGGYYRAPRRDIAANVSRSAKRILDCGCGGGELGAYLKSLGAYEVVGIEIVERAFEIAVDRLDAAFLGSVEDIELPYEDAYFDCIIFGDVLEHLVDPAAVLRKVEKKLAPHGEIVISIPNARFFQVVQMLAEGRWKYDDAGIMDRTHLRFFCKADIHDLIKDAGMDVDRIETLSMWPPDELQPDENGVLRFGRVTVGPVSTEEHQEFLTYQYLAVAVPAGGDRIEAARRSVAEGEYERALRIAAQATQGDAYERALILGESFAQLGKTDEAERWYRRALQDRSLPTEAQSALGGLLVANGRADEALPLLEAAASASGDSARTFELLGMARQVTGDEDAALTSFVRSLEIEFNNAPLIERLAQLARARNQLEAALPALHKYVSFYPAKPDAVFLYAKALADLGQIDEAREQLDTILMFNPDHEGAKALAARMQ